MEENIFDIVVSFDEKDKSLHFHRLYKGGKKVFLTSVSIDAIHCDGDPEKYADFVKILGENILLLLPPAAAHVGLFA